MAVMLSLLACTVLLAGATSKAKNSPWYSFAWKMNISVSNSVVAEWQKMKFCYKDGDLVMSDDFANITTYSTTIYINGSESCFLMVLMIRQVRQ